MTPQEKLTLLSCCDSLSKANLLPESHDKTIKILAVIAEIQDLIKQEDL